MFLLHNSLHHIFPPFPSYNINEVKFSEVPEYDSKMKHDKKYDYELHE